MHAHLPVRAGFRQRTSIADIAPFDDPDFASRRAYVGGKLVSDKPERVGQARAAPDLVEDLAYSVFPGCRHEIGLERKESGGVLTAPADSKLSAYRRQL